MARVKKENARRFRTKAEAMRAEYYLSDIRRLGVSEGEMKVLRRAGLFANDDEEMRSPGNHVVYSFQDMLGFAIYKKFKQIGLGLKYVKMAVAHLENERNGEVIIYSDDVARVAIRPWQAAKDVFSIFCEEG